MQELGKDIRKFIEEPILNAEDFLRNTAKKWACYCIQEHTGILLSRGLAISTAIANYLNERENKS